VKVAHSVPVDGPLDPREDATRAENRQQVLTALTADQSEATSAYREHGTPLYENR
jgi:hypothetical protein